jgi:undecaprenyl-diphosphatase
MLEFIASRDHRLMRCLNSWRAPRWFRIWMIAATRGGDGWLWYVMAFVVILFGDERRWITAAACGTATGTGALLFQYLKRRTGRKRPCAIAEHCWATLLPPDQFSFPSGHSITAFAITVPFGLFYPSLMPALMFCAVSIAISRVVLGMHFLSDVVAGSLIGAGLGYFSYTLYI